MKNRRKRKTENTELELQALIENEKEANRYAAKCLSVCALVGALSWFLNLIGIFIIPKTIMNTSMPILILCFLAPTLLCKITDGKSAWLKYVILLCGITGIFLLSVTMPKHGVLAWALPLMLSCHYYSRKLTHMTLVASWALFSASIYMSLYVGEGDLNLILGSYDFAKSNIETLYNMYLGSGEATRAVTDDMLYGATIFYVFPRAMILLGLSSIATTIAKRTRNLLEKQIKDSEERHRISAELDVATHIQANMLPRIFPAFPERPEFDIYASMNPAKEVGGDFYDFFMVDDKHLAIVMADVSGKGVPAALFMVIGKTLIKDHTTPGADLGQVFSEVNDLLCESNSEGLFITAFEGVLNLATGEFHFVNAGHEMPFIAKSGNVYEAYKLKPGFVLAGMENMKYQSGSITLSPGDKIFQYTDGVTEATNAANELYGIKRLTDILTKNTDKSPAELLPIVKADIDAFVGNAPQFDDITMLCVEYLKNMSDN
ncbi:MAG: PP2C family protein-serine/threonine phosphatase [Clostridium sp.]|nr:PP2C family protein-serine/threonine phosphatase [Clostridium sp.]